MLFNFPKITELVHSLDRLGIAGEHRAAIVLATQRLDEA
jgi:hypothetical protein